MAFSACFGGIIFSILRAEPGGGGLPGSRTPPHLRRSCARGGLHGVGVKPGCSPSPLAFPERDPDMLVGVGLGCLLQMSRGLPEVKVSGLHPPHPL